MFGNINKMATVWVHGFKDTCTDLEKLSKDLYKIEKEYGDKFIDEDT